jgi:multidrug efflux pump subunit AcrA (membrane-fusion protein)
VVVRLIVLVNSRADSWRAAGRGLVITQWDTLWPITTVGRGRPPPTWSAELIFLPDAPTVIRATNKENARSASCPVEAERGTIDEFARGRCQPRAVDSLPGCWRAFNLRGRLSAALKRISAVGYVEFNERDQRTVSARVNGRIDELFVSETGRLVGAGDDLALVYSPDLNVTAQNLLDARRTGSADLEASAKNRLELLGIDKQQLDEILAAGKADTHLKIRSPISGHVIQKYIREGQYIKGGVTRSDVADISTVWVEAQIYEDDRRAALGLAPQEARASNRRKE